MDGNKGPVPRISPAVEAKDKFNSENEFAEDILYAPQAAPREYIILYSRVIIFGYWHLAAIYGLYLSFTSAKIGTPILAFFLYVAGILGITAGAHRLWSHKTFKATLPLQIILMLFNSIASQFSAADWVRNHRLHHKFSDTDADPHNATRGFFFSHLGWLLVKKHPDVREKGKTTNMSDIYANPVLSFQDKYAAPLLVAVCFILPTIIPMYLWDESLNSAYHINTLRFVITLHVSLLANSASHLYGYKPYDINILPRQNILLNVLSMGEGFHNFHHVFPWDYRGTDQTCMINFTKTFIDFFSLIGWAYDFKIVSESMIKNRVQRTGVKSIGQKVDYLHVYEDDKKSRSL